MNTEQLRTLIKGSILLSEEEKTYWLKNLGVMNEEQLGKLEKILTDAQDIRWNDRIAHYVSLIGNAA